MYICSRKCCLHRKLCHPVMIVSSLKHLQFCIKSTCKIILYEQSSSSTVLMEYLCHNTSTTVLYIEYSIGKEYSGDKQKTIRAL